MSMVSLTTTDILRRIRFDPLTKKGSVLDVVQLVTNCGQGNATKVYQRILDQHPSILPKCQNLKFEGRGQKPTPSAHASTLVEIAWLCPGRAAKEFRRQGAVTLCRALGGDLSLVDEIRARHAEVDQEDQDALLAGTGVTVAEANGQALTNLDFSRQEEEVRMMRAKREALTVSTYRELVELAESETDMRDKLYLKDAARNMLRASLPATSALMHTEIDDGSHEPVTISGVAADMGMPLKRGEEIRAGRAVAALYRERHGTNPPKHTQFVDGAVRQVNSYFEKDRALIEDALSGM